MFKGIYSEFKSIKLMKTKLVLFRQKQEVSTIYLFRPSMTPRALLVLGTQFIKTVRNREQDISQLIAPHVVLGR